MTVHIGIWKYLHNAFMQSTRRKLNPTKILDFNHLSHFDKASPPDSDLLPLPCALRWRIEVIRFDFCDTLLLVDETADFSTSTS